MVLATVNAHRQLLLGQSDVDLKLTGPLANLFASADGWRHDGLLTTSKFLKDMLAAHETTRREDSVGQSADTVIRTLSLYWGVRTVPRSAKRAGSASDPEIADSTVSDWHFQACHDEKVHLAAEVWLRSRDWLSQPVLPGGPRPQWTTKPFDWPGEPQRTEWRARVVDVLSGWALTEQPDSFLLMRAAILRELSEEISPQAPRSADDVREFSPVERFLIHRVILPWGREDALEAAPPPEPVLDVRNSYSAGAAAAVERAGYWAFDAAGGEANIVQILIDREGIAAFLADSRVDLKDGLLRLAPTVAGVVARQLLPGQTIPKQQKPSSADPDALTALFRDNSLVGPLEVLEFSRLIHQEKDRGQAESYIRLYLRRRLDVHATSLLQRRRSLPAFTADEVRSAFALADMNVHLRMTDYRMTKESSVLGSIIRSLGEDYGFRSLSIRDDALTATKERNYRGAVSLLTQSEEAIARRRTSVAVVSREHLETRHQVSLAATAVCVSFVERHLERIVSADDVDGLSLFVNAALHRSRTTLQLLEELDFALGGLPVQRSEDSRHIAWRDWWVTSRQIRMRVLIAAHTAVDANLVAERGISEPVDLSVLRAAYRSLLEIPYLRRESLSTVGMQATWLSMLDGGRLPVEPNLSNAVPRLTFVDGDPTSMLGDLPMATLDLAGSAAWHVAGKDPGTLGRMVAGGRVWKTLDRTSGGKYSIWRDMIDEISPIRRRRFSVRIQRRDRNKPDG